MKIFVIRHGQTDWNVEGRIQGSLDIPLNETGVKQAKEVKNKVSSLPYDCIICSPLKRTRKTCEYINIKNVPIYYDDRIKEHCFGNLEGHYFDEFKNEEFYSKERVENDKNLETPEVFCKRVYAFMEDMVQTYKDKNVLLVTHGGVAKNIYKFIHGMKIEEKLEGFFQENCQIVTYEYPNKNN